MRSGRTNSVCGHTLSLLLTSNRIVVFQETAPLLHDFWLAETSDQGLLTSRAQELLSVALSAAKSAYVPTELRTYLNLTSSRSASTEISAPCGKEPPERDKGGSRARGL